MGIKMKIQLCTAVCVLTIAGLVAASTYHIPTISLETPNESICPLDTQLEAARNDISSGLSGVYIEIAANMTTIPDCGGSGWRRVAFLDMRDSDQTCPSNWRQFSQHSIRACGRGESDTASCNSVQFSSDGYEYTQVCGRIVGYQYGSPDGSTNSHAYITLTPGNEINEPYVDGVSVTYGMPRQHIWTLYGGARSGGVNLCCSDTIYTSASFLENNYFCDTSNPVDEWQSILYTDTPLWDGIAGCGDASCCAPHSGPWFHAILTDPTSHDIEVRICGDEPTTNEDTPVELFEIYVK